MTLPTTTGLRPQQEADGSWAIPGMPGLSALTIEEDAGPVRDWLAELNLPHDWAALELLSTAEGFSRRRLSFVICDESQTRFTRHFRFQPRRIAHTVDGLRFTLEHTNFVIGECLNVHLAQLGEVADIEGAALIGNAVLYDSTLALKAWEGIKRNIFTHVCAVLLRPPGVPDGQGGIFEVSLTSYPGCPGARILGAWEENS